MKKPSYLIPRAVSVPGLLKTYLLLAAAGAFSVALGPVSAATITVPTDQVTIQDAIAAANAGDTILVEAGTYSGPVTLDKNNLTLEGIPSGTTKPEISIADPDASLGTVMIAPNLTGVTLKGFKIIGIDGTPGLEKAAVYLQGQQTNLTIEDNEIVAAGDSALLSEWNALLNGIVVTNNIFSGSTFNGPGSGGPGGGGQFVEPNWPRAVVYFGGDNNGANNSNIVFRDNLITSVCGDANNSMVSVTLNGVNVEISGNEFGGDTGSVTGISLLTARGENAVITDNIFSGLSALGARVGSGPTNRFSENSFTGIYPVALRNSGVDTLDARFNYWGLDGAAASKAAVAGLIVGPVEFARWYEDAARTVLSPLPGVHPDLQLGKDSSNQFDRDFTLRSKNGKPVNALAMIVNRGDTPEPLAVRADTKARFFKVSYLSGSSNVTAGLTAGTHLTPVLDGNSAPLWIKCTISPKRNRDNRLSKQEKRYSTFIQTTSTSDPNASDGHSLRVKASYRRSPRSVSSPR